MRRKNATAERKAGVKTPEADRTEFVMTDEDWSTLGESTWQRKRKLLPNLRLTYPDGNELRRIAELAEVDDSSESFTPHIHGIILDAHLDHETFRTLAIPQVKKTLKSIASQVNRLGTMLSRLDVGRGSIGSPKRAGYLIEKELYAVQKSKKEQIILIPQYIDLLTTLSDAAKRAAHAPMYEEKGAGGNPAFDRFIRNLLMTARMFGGRWTNYRRNDQIWCGTLLDALEILKKYLPKQGFFPVGEIGGSVQHIRTKLDRHMARARTRQNKQSKNAAGY